MAAELKYAEITQKVIGCAMQVHTFFGAGFPEIIYQKSLIIELESAGSSSKSEVEKDIIISINLLVKED